MKTALITGATSRLGVPLARFFARENYRVLLHVHSARKAAQELADSLAQQGAQAEILAADFADPAQIARFCSELTARKIAPDVIVNNASVFQHDFPGQGDPAILAASLSVHVTAPFMILEAAAALEKPQAALTVLQHSRPEAAQPQSGLLFLHARQERADGADGALADNR